MRDPLHSRSDMHGTADAAPHETEAGMHKQSRETSERRRMGPSCSTSMGCPRECGGRAYRPRFRPSRVTRAPLTPRLRGGTPWIMKAWSSEWLRVTGVLLLAWAASTGAVIGLQSATDQALPPNVAKVAPFIAAGLLTGWFIPMSTWHPRVGATVVLAFVSAIGWTAFSALSIDGAQVPMLFAASLPVMGVVSVWAYLGMALAGRRHRSASALRATSAPRGSAGDSDLDDLERELRREVEGEQRDGGRSAPPDEDG